MEPRHNEEPRNWGNLFAITRFRYIEVLLHMFYYYWGKENLSLYRGLRYIEFRYNEVSLSCSYPTIPRSLLGSKGGAVVRALAFHQCGPGLNPGVEAICGLSLLLVLSFAPRGFLRVLRFSPLLKNQHFQIPIRSGTHGHVSTSSYELLSAPWVNKLQFTILQLQFFI